MDVFGCVKLSWSWSIQEQAILFEQKANACLDHHILINA
jgi:hypothetical protein